MSEKHQINPAIAAALRTQLRDACQERNCSQGDLVEAALIAYLAPAPDSDPLDIVMAKLASIDATLAALVEVCEHLAPAQASVATSRVASYEQMYGPITPAVPPQPLQLPAPTRHANRATWKWFVREVNNVSP
jgi:hypothetical protein